MKRFVLTLALAIFAVTALAGCKGGSKVANAGEPLKVYSLQDLKDYCKDGTVIEVSFWHSFGHNITSALDTIIESFEEDMKKEGILIDVKAESTGGGYNGLRSRINLGTKSKAIPTMALGYPDHFADYINNGIMLSLDEFISSKEVGLTAAEQADYIDTYWNESIFTIDGKESVVGIPFNKSSEVMYYNSSVVTPILNSLGYATDGEWVNPTWEQVWEVSQKIKDAVATTAGLSWTYKNATYKADSKTTYPVIIDSSSNFVITTSRQWGGDNTYTRFQEGTTNGEVVLDNPSVRAAQEYFLGKANANLWQFPDKLSQSYGSALMKNSQSFISIGSTAGVKNNNDPKYQLKVTTMPQISYDDKSTQSVIQQGTNACILSANSNNYTRAAAWQLIKYMTSADKTSQFSQETGYLPVRQSAIDSEEFQQFLKETDSVFTGTVAMAINAAYQQSDFFYTDIAFSGSSIIRDKVGAAMISVYCQDKPLNDALKSLYNDLNNLKIKCTVLS